VAALIGVAALIAAYVFWFDREPTPAAGDQTRADSGRVESASNPAGDQGVGRGVGETGRLADRGAEADSSSPAGEAGESVDQSSAAVADAGSNPLAEAIERTMQGGKGEPTGAALPAPIVKVPASAGAGARGAMGSSRGISAAKEAIAGNDLLAGRSILNRVLSDPSTPADERERVRGELAQLNEKLLFSPKVYPSDPLVGTYEVRPGDSLERIASRLGLAVDWRLLQRVNRLKNPNHIQVGQTLKIVRGPFHAVVHKGEFRLDVYAGPPDEKSEWVYIRSFPVGLGAQDSTPVGRFVVRANSKLLNPSWINPRTRQRFGSEDPKNPIGEHWIGLEGVGAAADQAGYGLHGTIQPASIGRTESMGCIRLNEDDVSLLYEMLVERVSVVEIQD